MPDFSHRGYLVRSNHLNGAMWIEKDGRLICHVTDKEEARKTIDMLLEDTDSTTAAIDRLSAADRSDARRAVGLE